jgi:hypothetical protein
MNDTATDFRASDYRVVIGLEVHAQMNTKTKMFCACQNDPDEKRPNVNICPICLAHPGTLPFANAEAVRPWANAVHACLRAPGAASPPPARIAAARPSASAAASPLSVRCWGVAFIAPTNLWKLTSSTLRT